MAIVRREVVLPDTGHGVTHFGVSVFGRSSIRKATHTARSACSRI